MHASDFIQDLAVIMLMAGFITILFHRLKQPVVLGYIVAGLIIGPHTPPFELISNQETIDTIASLGIVFLMFSLGLEFNVRRLSKVGIPAFFAALAEIILMIWLGYEIGIKFGWSALDAIFLGAMLAISSTTIIVKALNELGFKREKFVQLIFGILIIEDILGVAILAILSGFAVNGSVNVTDMFSTIGKLIILIVILLLVGILTIPRLISYVASFKSDEMLLITVLGLCFGFCFLAIKLNYSVALGAFIIGAIIAESKDLVTVERLINPVRDMFSAVFFVSVGLMINPPILIQYAMPILIITVAVIVGKVIACSVSMFILGKDAHTSVKVGMGMAQIGEFSFIIAALGDSLDVTSSFLYPVAVAVSVITTFFTPYLIRWSNPFVDFLQSVVPQSWQEKSKAYTRWVSQVGFAHPEKTKIINYVILQVFINLTITAAIFFVGSYFADYIDSQAVLKTSMRNIWKTLLCIGLLILSLPFILTLYRKLKIITLLFTEPHKRHYQSVRAMIQFVPASIVLSTLIVMMSLAGDILPPTQLIIVIIILVLLLSILLRRFLIKTYKKLQNSLAETMKEKNES